MLYDYAPVVYPFAELTISYLASFPWPNPYDPGRVEGLRDETQALRESTDYAIVTDIMVGGPFEQATRSRGAEQFMIDLAWDARFAHTLLGKLTDVAIGMWDAQLSAIGHLVDVVCQGDDLGMQSGLQVSPKMYREFVKPCHERIFSFIHSKTRAKVFLHSCGSVYSILPDLIEVGVDFLNPVQVRPRVRVAERPPRALPCAQVRRIFRCLCRTQAPGKRDFAMLLMMAMYGLGAGEILSLRLDDVDWDSEVLHVRRPKTGVTIDLPLLPAVARALAAYLQLERPRHAESRRVFLSTGLPHEPLTSGAIRHRIRLYARLAGIKETTLGAYVFRHSHASRQVDAGTSLKVLSDILGHRRPSSTSVYVRVALRRLHTVALMKAISWSILPKIRRQKSSLCTWNPSLMFPAFATPCPV